VRIIRVFPSRTNLTPTDEYAFYDVPGMFIPDHDEVHICTVFTWDIKKGEWLRDNWQDHTDKPVKLGGPVYGDYGDDFVTGRYLKPGVTFTSRGCNNQCGFCLVPGREGKLRELQTIHPGHIIQDNNFMQCSKEHRRKVYYMLKTQKEIEFSGGIEAARLTEWDVEQLRGLRVKSLFLACDTKSAIKSLEKAVALLHKGGFDLTKQGEPARNKIRSYVLIGDDLQENEERLRRVYEIGALPFAQLFQPLDPIEYSDDWRQFARTWQRPAATRAHMKAGAA
jgi:hypothetical protein